MSANSVTGSRPEVGVLVPAGGQGTRLGGGPPKQFRPIGGVPMLLRALRPFATHPAVRQIVVALPAADATTPPPWLAELAGERLRLVAGGDTRADSVRAALAALDPACAIVLVHDAARPFVTAEEVDAVIDSAAGGVGAVPALAVTDTLKRSADGRRVETTEPRRGLWRAQTPQGFPRALFEEAVGQAVRRGDLAQATDDAALVEAAGGTVVLVPGRATNFKVTTADDFRVAEALAAP